MTKMGPNDASDVVWDLGAFLKVFCILTNVLCSI